MQQPLCCESNAPDGRNASIRRNFSAGMLFATLGACDDVSCKMTDLTVVVFADVAPAIVKRTFTDMMVPGAAPPVHFCVRQTEAVKEAADGGTTNIRAKATLMQAVARIAACMRWLVGRQTEHRPGYYDLVPVAQLVSEFCVASLVVQTCRWQLISRRSLEVPQRVRTVPGSPGVPKSTLIH